jgi:hypothetical protein
MRRFGLILAGAALVIAACSSSTGSTPVTNGSVPAGSSSARGAASQAANPTTGPVSGGSHQFTATLTVTGAVKFTLSFTQSLSVLPACSALAKTGFSSNTWSIPQPNTQDSKLNWNVQPYTGPGTYSDTSTFGNSVELTGPKGDEYDQVDSSVGSVTVNADGSGSATFKDLEDSDAKAVSGSETWTCS